MKNPEKVKRLKGQNLNVLNKTKNFKINSLITTTNKMSDSNQKKPDVNKKNS